MTGVDLRFPECPRCPALITYAWLSARYFVDFLELVDTLREGASDPWATARDIRLRSAHARGAHMAADAGGADLDRFFELYWARFPNVRRVEQRPGVLVAEATGCAFYDGLADIGITRERLKRLSELTCIADQETATGFNPAVRVIQPSNMMHGDATCRWIHVESGHEASTPGTEQRPDVAGRRAIASVSPRLPHEECSDCFPLFKRLRARHFLDFVLAAERWHDLRGRTAAEICAIVRVDNFREEGRLLAARSQGRDLPHFVQAFWQHLPYVDVVERTDRRCVFAAARYPFLEALRDAKVPASRLEELGAIFGLMEEAIASGFNDEIRVRRTRSLFAGDDRMEWCVEV